MEGEVCAQLAQVNKDFSCFLLPKKRIKALSLEINV